jgi:steroid delta-isomerase-like uncharacterized protein
MDALNAHDIERYVRNVDDSYTIETEILPTPARGPDGARKVLQMNFTAFPDLRFEQEQLLATPTHMIVCWRATGTQKGEYAGIAPTNKRATIKGCSVAEVQNGKLRSVRIYADNASLLQQLGVLKLGKTMAAG